MTNLTKDQARDTFRTWRWDLEQGLRAAKVPDDVYDEVLEAVDELLMPATDDPFREIARICARVTRSLQRTELDEIEADVFVKSIRDAATLLMEHLADDDT